MGLTLFHLIVTFVPNCCNCYFLTFGTGTLLLHPSVQKAPRAIKGIYRMLQEILIIDIYLHKMYYVPTKNRED